MSLLSFPIVVSSISRHQLSQAENRQRFQLSPKAPHIPRTRKTIRDRLVIPYP
jgi:hypothetical protein